jgi:acetolactate synthase regulatory subunit
LDAQAIKVERVCGHAVHEIMEVDTSTEGGVVSIELVVDYRRRGEVAILTEQRPALDGCIALEYV